jgi:hypothetical protein
VLIFLIVRARIVFRPRPISSTSVSECPTCIDITFVGEAIGVIGVISTALSIGGEKRQYQTVPFVSPTVEAPERRVGGTRYERDATLASTQPPRRHQSLSLIQRIAIFCRMYRIIFMILILLLKLLMIRTTCFSVLARITALIFIIGVLAVAIVSIQDTPAAAIGGNSSQGIANKTIGAGQNITGSLSLRNMLAKTAGSEVHVSLANASTIAEKAVGPNSHAVSVRIGVLHGFVVYVALVSDINHSIHSVLVDAGNGKVLRSTQLSIAPPMMMQHG